MELLLQHFDVIDHPLACASSLSNFRLCCSKVYESLIDHGSQDVKSELFGVGSHVSPFVLPDELISTKQTDLTLFGTLIDILRMNNLRAVHKRRQEQSQALLRMFRYRI